MEKNFKVFMRMCRVAVTPRAWMLKSTLANGAVVYGTNRSGHGGRGVYVYRDALEPEFQFLEDFLQPAGVFLDIGANTGIYTIKAAKFLQAGGGAVIAFEPLPNMLATLYRNVMANRLTNVRLRSFCLGDRTHPDTLWINFSRPVSSSILRRDEQASSLPVLVMALDDVFKWEGLDRLDYVKIDVEGVEEQVLSGAKETFKKFRPIIQVEVSIADTALDLKDYTVFQAPGSPNKVFFPNGNPGIHAAKARGWTKVG
jgi:FkbM family methyltransferase